MGFSGQQNWSGLPFPSPENLPHPGIEPRSPVLQAGSLPSELQGSPRTKKALWAVRRASQRRQLLWALNNEESVKRNTDTSYIVFFILPTRRLPCPREKKLIKIMICHNALILGVKKFHPQNM